MSTQQMQSDPQTSVPQRRISRFRKPNLPANVGSFDSRRYRVALRSRPSRLTVPNYRNSTQKYCPYGRYCAGNRRAVERNLGARQPFISHGDSKAERGVITYCRLWRDYVREKMLIYGGVVLREDKKRHRGGEQSALGFTIGRFSCRNDSCLGGSGKNTVIENL